MEHDKGVTNPTPTVWPAPTSDPPDLETLKEWQWDAGGVEATDGCWVEEDGVCPHGHPSWLLWWHMI